MCIFLYFLKLTQKPLKSLNMNINLMHLILSLEELLQRLVLNKVTSTSFSLALISHSKTHILLVDFLSLLANQVKILRLDSSIRNINHLIINSLVFFTKNSDIKRIHGLSSFLSCIQRRLKISKNFLIYLKKHFF